MILSDRPTRARKPGKKALEAENARLRAALEKFARFVNEMDALRPAFYRDDDTLLSYDGVEITVGDLREARAALEAHDA